jgi:hypothetical protein
MKYFRFVSAVIFPFLSAGIVFGGSANATIECKSQDGVTLAGDIPGDFTTFNLNLSVGKSTLAVSDKNEKIFVTEDFPLNVFSFVVVRKDDPALQLYAIPTTIKGQGADASFDAMLLAPHPQAPSSLGKMLRDVKMTCRYHYSI